MPSRTLPGLGLAGFWALGEDGWNTGTDQNWLKLSALVQLSVLSRVTALPGSPTNGDIYIVPDAAGADAKKIAVRDNGAWVYIVPLEGWRAWVKDTDELVVFDGSSWVVFESGGIEDAPSDGEFYVRKDAAWAVLPEGTSGDGTIVFGPASLSYALVTQASAQSIPDATTTALSWSTEVVDSGGWFNPAQPTRFTVPAGVTAIRIVGAAGTVSATGQLVVSVYKNGTLAAGCPVQDTDTNGGDTCSVASGILPVTAGDYFELMAYVDGARDTDTTRCFFSIEMVATSSPGNALPYDVRFGFNSVPTAAQVLDTIVLPRSVTFDANFAGSVGKIYVNPTASFVMSLLDDGVAFGTVTVSTSGVFTFATSSGVPYTLAAGSILTLAAPASADATAANCAFTLKGSA